MLCFAVVLNLRMKHRHIGLFFGSFNPIHYGHLIIANFMATQSDLDEVWFVVSPQNPFKDKKTLAPARERLQMVHLAIGNNYQLRPCDIELSMPQPSYTIDTLAYLKDKYPNRTFTLIMGEDNLPTLPKWKNADILLRDYKIYVYARPGIESGPLKDHPNVTIYKDIPLMDISSSHIRQYIKAGHSITYMTPPKVEKHLLYWNLYK